MERPDFVNGHIYHIYNRGVEKRDTFLETRDYLRFIIDLYQFNDSSAVFNLGRGVGLQPIEVRLQSVRKEILVEIFTFCLMPNHYHLMLRQKINGGITEFMRKLGTGYTNYFNLKYQRVGSLFQGKFKAVLLEEESHFIHLPHYIHLNPLDISMPAWRDGSVTNVKKALEFLKTYRWSSLPDYLGSKNFPSVTERGFLKECIGGPEKFYGYLHSWIQDAPLGLIHDITLD